MGDTGSKPNFADLERLFPGLGPEDYAQLDAWYTGYAALILRIYERLTADPEAYARFRALTDLPPGPTMTSKAESKITTTASEA